MTGWLLDTNVLSDLVRHPAGAAARRLAEVGEAGVVTSVVVAAELRYGAARKGSDRLTARVEALLSEIPVLPLAPPVDAAYGRIRAALEARGTPIGGNDLLIAAHALATGRAVVTANVREFERVDGLAVENWLAG
ncbi:type II toxin-antitoxin system VapC family toxin [Jannaschia sp. Os4]|uniref:type II toxin-antitoxin system VapC family toxin n=1 Tax=Jannaschia sp. Os4 TaxID=2807617 RepID=UPI0019392EDA|nr:type II toxin-antitoxin system VapC family toxin [Jannaschia sp. Os4]MBM2578082.1 type II toxin-antitoxin system VapC family toxin [Jannaschia sp. Os4]MBM2578112.1 type II toxin-antitoxin system VapC family toxin [Jannaschia sp. Os4]